MGKLREELVKFLIYWCGENPVDKERCERVIDKYLSMPKEIYSFGEFKSDKWYELKDGTKITCDEDTIQKLWNQWVVNMTAKKEELNGATIFKCATPIYL